MSTVSTEFLARWRQEVATLTGGPAKRMQRPVTKVYYRKGRVKRENKPWDGPEINAYVVGEDVDNDNPWQGTYTPNTSWAEIPDVVSCDIEHALDSRTGSVTIVVGNARLAAASAGSGIAEDDFEGFSGLYHAVERGWLSPWRGSETEFTLPATASANAWYTELDQKAQIKVWQGYGADELVPTFLGFIDELNLTAAPDQITITARDASQIAGDQRFYGWSKQREIPDPITFADRVTASETTRVGSNADASSDQTGYEASKVLDGDPDTHWRSDDGPTGDYTEWVEIELPEGLYSTFRINTENYGGMTAFAAIYSVGGQVDGDPVDDGWVDIGNDPVIGENGGFTYVKQFETLDGAKTVTLPFTFIGGDGSRLRVAFRDLKAKGDDFRAGVVALKAIRQPLIDSIANTEGWILVDDASDIVRLILRWCGFKEWYVEDSGMRVEDRYVVNRESFLMDMIDHVIEKTGFVFHIADPDTDDDSLGYPVFRQNRAQRELDAVDIPIIKDTDLVRRAEVRFTSEPLAHIIRVRGTTATKDEGGVVLSRDERRLLAVYRPPWALTVPPQTARIYRRTFLDRFYIKRQVNLEYTARDIAFRQALASATATIEIPANPGIGLDQHILLQDVGTGLNTRLWTATRASSFSAGEQPRWVMSLGGALLDTPNMAAIRTELRELEESKDD